MMVILGLTGSIAMGKTTAAEMFARLGVPVFDADRAVHRLLGRGGAAVAAVEAAFPGTVREGAVDRQALAARVFDDEAKLRTLEAILHPQVEADQNRFLRWAARNRRRLVVLDVPLLFETAGERVCDAVAVVSAPAFLQEQRLLRRSGMTRERLEAIRNRQAPDASKLRRADFIIPSGLGRALTRRAIAALIDELQRGRGRKWTPAQSRRRLDGVCRRG
ncbi:MAG: dephospho-CoA kinase [Rhodospirillales bacterium]